MLFVVLSPPSPASVWAIPAIRTIAKLALGSVDYLQLSTAAQLREELKSRRERHLMLFSDCPDIDIVTILSKNAAPTIVLAEDPAIVASHLCKYAAQEPVAAVRIASSTFATLHDAILASNNLMTLSQPSLKSAELLVGQVADYLGFSLSADQIGSVMQVIHREATAFEQSQISRKAFEPETAGHDVAALAEALRPFHTIFQSDNPADGFVWPLGLFFITNPPGSPLTGPIDLTGPARAFLYGPFLHMPRGNWDANVRFQVSQNISGNKLLVEFIAGTEVISTSCTRLPNRGAFDFTMPFAVREPRDPIQMRLSIQEGAIEGTFALIEVKLHRSSPAA